MMNDPRSSIQLVNVRSFRQPLLMRMCVLWLHAFAPYTLPCN
jgi:hypothetical protein